MTSSCTGRGPDGSHCCYVNGEVCPALILVEDRPRCSLLMDLGSWEAVHTDPRYQALPVAAWFEKTHPGYGCGDWPQNIPEVMARPRGRCCYDRKEEAS